jgi:hypothetical protein
MTARVSWVTCQSRQNPVAKVAYLDSQKEIGNVQQRVANEWKVPHGLVRKPPWQLQANSNIINVMGGR